MSSLPSLYNLPCFPLLCPHRKVSTELGEANFFGVLTEALTADVELILADNSFLVGADNAITGALAHPNFLARTPLIQMSHCFCLFLLLVFYLFEY